VEFIMKSSVWIGVLFLAGAGALTAQQSNGQFEGKSNPPADGTITTYQEPVAKPAPGRPMNVTPAQPASTAEPDTAAQPPQVETKPAQSASADARSSQSDASDDGIVMLAPDSGSQPALNQREAASDPDGDIVHPAPPPPGTLGYGTTIRAKLRERLSTAYTDAGEPFHATVASDVFQDGHVLIPAGSEIDGTVTHVSTGRFAGHGSMVLRPQTVTLPNGSKYHLYAQVEGSPGTNAHVGEEGEIVPGSRLKKDGILYGGGVGVGMIAGGAVAGPAGILAGSLISAGAVTAHLMMDHPQATLEEGSVLLFSLTQSLHLAPDPEPQARGEQPSSQQPSFQ
jgi:hypothetical protein